MNTKIKDGRMIANINDLKNWDRNPRSIKGDDFERLKRQIIMLGQHTPLLVDENGVVYGGNMRLRAYRDLGITDVWISPIEGDDKKKLEYALSSNDRAGYYEDQQLAELVSSFPDLKLEDYKVDIGEPIGLDELLAQFGPEKEEWKEEEVKNIKDIKILNLYAGIGGNRKFWGDLKVTAVEYNQEIAKIYKDYFPDDELVVGDAHKYLEDNFDKFDFIWTSPPCPTHSLLRKGLSIAAGAKPKFPDMKLYEEILFLQGYFKGKWVVENVRSWYEPLVEPQERGRHYYWANFNIPESDIFNVKEVGSPEEIGYSESSEKYGFNLDKYQVSSKYPKDKILRNMVHPKAGKYILECAFGREKNGRR